MPTAPRQVGLTAKHVELANTSDVDPVVLADGLEMIRREKDMSVREALRVHWRAMAWSVALSFALVMDGYDGSIAYSFFALPAFQKRFGEPYKKGYVINGNWQTAVGTILLPGNLAALAIVGWASDRYGCKRVYAAGMLFTIAVIFLFVFLQSIQMMVGASVLGAFCWGLFQTLTSGYAVEICPIRLRGIAASFISMAWGLGGFLASGVSRGALQMDQNGAGDWSWRMPYMLQWVWPVPLFFVAIFAPESPYWLVRQGRLEDAKKVLRRVAAPGYYDERSLDGYVAYMKHTDDLERAESANGSFWEMFKGTNLRRTEALLAVWAVQQWSGLTMTSYAVQFFKSAGLSNVGAFNLNMVVTSMNIVGCGIEFFIVNMFSRRAILLVGTGSLALFLLLIGVLGSVHPNGNTQRGIGAFMVMLNLIFHASTGPITYTISAELPASRLRQRSIALGRAFYACSGAVVSQLTPRMVSPVNWNWGAKAGYFYFGTNVLTLVWAYFRVPETGCFSFAELEVLFANNVSPRKFTKVKLHNEAAEPISNKGDEHEAEHVEHVA